MKNVNIILCAGGAYRICRRIVLKTLKLAVTKDNCLFSAS